MKLKAFHGKKSIKDKYLARVKAHYEADEIIQGRYWENGKGCAVGCTIEASREPHDTFQKELGISWRVALIEDSLFENLKNGEAKKFPLQFLQAIPVGADTDLVYKKFVIWVLGDKKDGLVNMIKDKKKKDLLNRVLKLYKKSLKTEIKVEEWKALADEACSASTSASAYASAYASTSASAYASAYASTSASAYASAYASTSAPYGDKWKEIFNNRVLTMRDKLLSLLKSAK